MRLVFSSCVLRYWRLPWGRASERASRPREGGGPSCYKCRETAEIVMLPIKVRVQDALDTALKAKAKVLEFRFSGNGVIGGLRPSGVPPKYQAAWAEIAFQRRFKRVPVVSALIVAPQTSETQMGDLRSAMATLPKAAAISAPVKFSRSLGVKRAPSTLAGSIDEHFPSWWAGNTYRYRLKYRL